MLLTSGMRNETERENARTLWASEETEAPSSKGLSQGQTQAVSSRSKMWTPLDFNYNCPALPSSSLQNPGRTRSQSQHQKRPCPLLRNSVQNKGTVCFSKSVRTYGRYCFSIKLSTIVLKLSGDWPEHPHEFLFMGPLCIETEKADGPECQLQTMPQLCPCTGLHSVLLKFTSFSDWLYLEIGSLQM